MKRLEKCCLKENELVYGKAARDKSFDGYGFRLENVKMIEEIPVKGALSFWEYDYKE